jgi:uncharacterized protein (TIGR04255 family)
MKQVKKLTPNPISEVIAEFRFNSDKSGSELTFALKSRLGNSFPTLGEVPNQIPKELRDTNEAFKYQPTYSLSSDKYLIRIGSNVISVHFVKKDDLDYPGWDAYCGIIQEVIEKLLADNPLQEFNRVSIRYVNIFEPSEVWSAVKLGVKHPFKNSEVKMELGSVISFTVQHETDDIKTRVYVSPEVIFTVNGASENKLASVLDLDTAINSKVPVKDAISRLGDCHEFGEKVFFELLDEKYVSKNYKVTE